MNRYLAGGTLALWFLGMPGGVLAEGAADLEAKLLPPYCTGDPAWREILGPAIESNNHTCYGLTKLNRYYKLTSSRQRKELLQEALGDFNYSVHHLKPDFKLMPEIYTYRGEVLRLLGRHGEAATDLTKAIGLDAKYVKAYNALADLYEENLKRKDKALETVTEGLRQAPGSKALKRRYFELGGKEPLPAPYEAQPAQAEKPAEKAADKAADKAAEKVAEKPGEKPVAEKPAEQPAEKPAPGAQAEAAPGPVTSTPVMPEPPPAPPGMPGNPWCRFCPEPVVESDPGKATPPAAPTTAQ